MDINMDIDKDFIKHWMSAGDTEDVLNQFVCYFIIFNYLYEVYHYQKYENQQESDRKKIMNFLEYSHNNFNPFSVLSEKSELVKMPVKEVKNGYLVESIHNNKICVNNLSLKNIQRLFMNIYQVRCNLFHGQKSMISLRDNGLVKESANVLKLFLQTYLTT